MARLCLLGEGGEVSEFWEIGKEPVAVGRDNTADVAIDDETLSCRHFMIVREGEGYLLKDLNSQNGTWVAGRRADPQGEKLGHNKCIAAGRTLFLFREHQPGAAAGGG